MNLKISRSDMSEQSITIRKARVHNLKNVSVVIPRDKLIVITGVSGSGKSSLAFDTIYAEGQRRYIESLSSYARQFLDRMNKPDVDFISGIPPAIAIEQKPNTRNPRSTVGTTTEIYDYLRLLYARVGHTYSPVSGREVKRHSADDITKYIAKQPAGTPVILLAPTVIPENIDIQEYCQFLSKQGFTRIEISGTIHRVDEESTASKLKGGDIIGIVIDRVISGDDPDLLSRIADSAETAFRVGDGRCIISFEKDGKAKRRNFSSRFEEDGIEFMEPVELLFSFNNPLGACPVCEGYGKIIGTDENLVVPDQNLSVFEDAIVCWKGETMSLWKERLIKSADKFDFPIHKPYYQLTPGQRDLLWEGNDYFFGINDFFKHLEEKKYKIQYRVLLSRYRGKTVCPGCKGKRLRKEASYVLINGISIQELTALPIGELYKYFNSLKLPGNDARIGERILEEIRSRLKFVFDVGLSYLTLDRLAASLSGGEAQRINLATSLGSNLVGSLYILDEPSIGLHPRDTHLLLAVLEDLRDMGNTVIVVEHEEEIMRSADEIIDMGPEAGRLGGEVVYQGPLDAAAGSKSLTMKYLSGELSIAVPSRRRKWNSYIEVSGARANNLKNIDVKFPLNVMTVVTGVSGSGKSTLVSQILYRALNNKINGFSQKPGQHKVISGDLSRVTAIDLVDQNPIGRSSRSNPVTYIKAYDEIRKLYSEQKLSVQNGYKPSHFSFNVDGGRCDECQGEGIIKVEMQFMADVELTCEVCGGKRFRKDVLDVKFNGKNIHDVLEMTVDEAILFFISSKEKGALKIAEKLTPLADVGLGYITLGQSSSTLSGGESQRVKLAFFLAHSRDNEHFMFIFDEPTTGLHLNDIGKLLKSLNALVEKGHTVVMIEHNLEVIKSADWIIDLGPEGGDAGGYLVFAGTPEELVSGSESITGKFLATKL